MSEDVKSAVAAAVKSTTAGSYGRIERAMMHAVSPFIRAGHRASSAMEEGVNRATLEEVKVIAGEMLAKVREYDPNNAAQHHQVVGNVLAEIVDVITRKRVEMMERNLRNETRIRQMTGEFKQDMQRVVDDAIRDLKHQRLQHTGGNTYVAMGDVNAPVNMALGQNNQAQQTIVTDQFAGLRDALAAFRAAAANSSVSEDLRLGVIRQVEVVEAELAKPQPNEGTVKWLSKWFVEKASGPAFVTALSRLFDWLAGA